jgi:hypothetical protein
MEKITFTTNVGKNTLEYVKLLLESLKVNLDGDEHEILIFIDSDNENTLEYLLSIKNDFKDLKIIENKLPVPIGYARNKTILTEYAKHDIISYLQSDMVVGPHYDTEILKHIKRGRILSSTRVEPPLHGESPVTITKNFGIHPSEFNLEKWNEFSISNKTDKLINYFFAPISYYKQDWLALGGYDTVFRRSREDSDFVQRCLHADIELVQTYSANVYHFTCVSSRGKNWFDTTDVEAQRRVEMQQYADVIELRRFIRKWGAFNHGEHALFKLDIDLVPKNYNLQTIANLEPFFTKVWLSSVDEKNSLLNEYVKLHDIANKLHNFSDDDWKAYQHLYRLENFDYIFNVGEPSSFNIKVDIDFANIKNNNQFLLNIQNLYDMLKDCEVGVYELDNIIVTVNAVTSMLTNIKTENPEFDYNLLAVH